MTRRRRILTTLLGVLLLGIAAGAFTLSRTDDCEPTPALDPATPHMKAIVYRCYGGPEVLRLEDVAKPTPADDEVLVRVHAAGINPLDWHYLRGEPYPMRMDVGLGKPKNPRLGVDFAGIVEAVGAKVTRFKPGDAVFGGANGSLAEYVVVRESRNIVAKPANVTFTDAAGVGIAGVTALQSLRDKGQLKAGQHVLVNGASGGVGTFAVQIAKALGAEVTGVASTRNVELVQSLGADHVVDYKTTDFTQQDVKYDLIIDNVGSHSMGAYRRVLQPEGTVVIVGSTSKGKWLGPIGSMLGAMVYSPFISQNVEPFLASMEPQALTELATLMESGKVKTVVDRRFPLSEAPAAIAYLEEGRARGKVIVDVAAQAPGATN